MGRAPKPTSPLEPSRARGGRVSAVKRMWWAISYGGLSPFGELSLPGAYAKVEYDVPRPEAVFEVPSLEA